MTVDKKIYTDMKRVLVCGAGGFIGGHLVKLLKNEGYWVRAVDIKIHDYVESSADEFIIGDLRNPKIVGEVIDQPFDELYQLAADMGGAGFIFSGENDKLATPLATKWLHNALNESVVIKVENFGHGAFMFSKDMTYFDKVLFILKK